MTYLIFKQFEISEALGAEHPRQLPDRQRNTLCNLINEETLPMYLTYFIESMQRIAQI